jgi:hypothetical protein
MAAHPAKHCRFGAEADDVSLADGLQTIADALKDGDILAKLPAGMSLVCSSSSRCSSGSGGSGGFN